MSSRNTSHLPSRNPKRVAAGRLNQQRRQGLTEAGRLAVQSTILVHQPWRHATGPKSAEGKAMCAKNGRLTRKGFTGVRETARALKAIRSMISMMRVSRTQAQQTISRMTSEMGDA